MHLHNCPLFFAFCWEINIGGYARHREFMPHVFMRLNTLLTIELIGRLRFALPYCKGTWKTINSQRWLACSSCSICRCSRNKSKMFYMGRRITYIAAAVCLATLKLYFFYIKMRITVVIFSPEIVFEPLKGTIDNYTSIFFVSQSMKSQALLISKCLPISNVGDF